MIVLVNHHYAYPEKLEAGRQRVHAQGLKMSAYPGFISRVTAEAVDDPTHIVAIGCWESEEALDGWDKGPDRRQDRAEWRQPVYRTRFNFVEEITPSRAP